MVIDSLIAFKRCRHLASKSPGKCIVAGGVMGQAPLRVCPRRASGGLSPDSRFCRESRQKGFAASRRGVVCDGPILPTPARVTMPAPLPPTTRRLILLRSGRGQTAAAIADALHLCPRTVRHLLQRARDPASPQGTAYRPGPGRPDDDHPLRAQALALRQQHPTWGAGYIRVRLATEADPATVPSEPHVAALVPPPAAPACGGGTAVAVGRRPCHRPA